MILEGIFTALLAPLDWLLALIPSIELNFPAGIGNIIANIFLTVKLFVPWNTVVSIFTIHFGITNWRIIWNVVQRIWDALPFT